MFAHTPELIDRLFYIRLFQYSVPVGSSEEFSRSLTIVHETNAKGEG